MKIYLAPKLSVDAPTAATQVIAAIGMRGSGKSNAMAVLAEGMLTAGTQVVILDYVGIWFSLRLKADGKTPDFEIPVLGGPHGDIVLPSAAGTIVARALAQTGSAAVVDLSAFSKTDRMRFATDFAEALFAEKKKHPGPCFLILEEAQRYIPQKMFSGQERMLGAFEEIAEVGRNYGLGLGLLSQRPQKLNKDVLNLTELLFAFQANGVLERKAISEWVQEKGAEGRAEVHGELPSLDVGQALVWSPRWLKIYGKFTLHKKTTYDAGATPLHARAVVKVKALDLGELETSMQEVVETAKATDPKALAMEVARLKRELAKREVTKSAKSTKMVVARTPKTVRAALVNAERETDYFSRQAQQIVQHAEKLKESLRLALDESQTTRAEASFSNGVQAAAALRTIDYGTTRARVDLDHPDRPLSACARAILGVLAQRERASASQLSILTGYSIKSSSFANALSELRTQGFVVGTREAFNATSAGLEIAPPSSPLPDGGPDLLAHWQSKLGRCERTMLGALAEQGPLNRDQLSAHTGYSITSSSFANALSTLRTLELVSGRDLLELAETFR